MAIVVRTSEHAQTVGGDERCGEEARPKPYVDIAIRPSEALLSKALTPAHRGHERATKDVSQQLAAVPQQHPTGKAGKGREQSCGPR